MIICGVDPGPDYYAWASIENGRVVDRGNVDLLDGHHLATLPMLVGRRAADVVVVERVRSFYLRVGQSVFDTQWTAARIYEALGRASAGGNVERAHLSRQEVLLTLIGRARGSDADVRLAIASHLGCGSAREAKGTKAAPGPCHGVRGHEWQALGVALSWALRAVDGGRLTPWQATKVR